MLNVTENDLTGLLVKPDLAVSQQSAEAVPSGIAPIASYPVSGSTTISAPRVTGSLSPAAPPKLTRFHGTVLLDPARAGRDASRVADEVIAHLSGLVGSEVKITLEIEARIPQGAPDNVVRIVTENSRTLNFMSQGFEPE